MKYGVAIVQGEVKQIPPEQEEAMQLLTEMPVEVQFRLVVPVSGG